MQENNMRLIDEATSFEPVKNTFRLGWEFITLNKKFTMSAIVVLLVLSLLGSIPMVGFVFSVFSSAFALAIQIYAGRLVYETENIETFVEEVHQIDGQKLIERHFAPALGAYMGWMVMALLLVGGISLFIGGAGVNVANNAELLALLATVGIPLLLVMLIFAYVQPLVQSNIVMANDFKEGFLAVFTIFSRDVWSSAMQGSYFKYISIYGIIVFFTAILFSFVFSLFAAIPILNIFIFIIFVYILSIMMTVSAVMARRIVEG
jgi:hypothetical protein